MALSAVRLVGPEPGDPGTGRSGLAVWRSLCPAVLLGLTLAATELTAQTALPDLSEEWRWVDFGPESGLPAGNVRDLVEAGGVVWLRTDEGVAYYDGFVWTNVGSALGLPAGAPTSLAVVRGDTLVLVVDGMIYRGGLHGFARLPVPLPPPFESSRVVRVLPDSVDSFYLTVIPSDTPGYELQSILFHASGRSVRQVDIPSPLSRPDGLWRARSGRLWIDTWRGLAVREGGRWRLREDSIRQDAAVRRITPVLVEDPSGVGIAQRIFPVPEMGLMGWEDGGPLRSIPGEGHNPALAADVRDGIVWVIYDTGDLRVLEHGVWRSVVLPTPRIDGLDFIHFADNGDLWVSSADGLHLFRSSAARWERRRWPFPDPRNRINAILVDRDTVTWLATEGGLVTRDAEGRETWINSILGRPPQVGTGLAQDSSGDIWLTSGLDLDGALRWDGKDWHAFGTREGLDAGRIHRVFGDREGGVWFMALGRQTREVAGVYRLAGGAVENVTRDRHLPPGAAFSFAEAPDGTVWLGLEEGLARLSGSQLTFWGPEQGLGLVNAAEVWDVALDPGGRVWFCHRPTRGMGLGYLDLDGTVHYVDPPGGVDGRQVLSLTVDAQGTLWAGSRAGVARLAGGVWTLFDTGTGLGAESVWPLVARPGALLIGTLGGGLVTLDLSYSSTPAPRVVVDAHAQGDVATLKWAAFAFWGETPGRRIPTRLRVDGGDWSAWSTDREWVRGGLPYGVHTAEVEAAGLFGQTDTPPVHATFRVVPPLMLQPGFVFSVGTLLVLLLGLGITGSIRRRRHAVALRLGEERWRSLVESAPEAIAIFDVHQGRFVLVNENVSKLLGIPSEEILEQDPNMVSAPVLPDGTSSETAARGAMTRALAGETVVLPWVAIAADGTEIPCELRIAPLAGAGPSLLRVSLLDVRGRLEAEARRAELEDELRQALKLEAIGKLTGGIAHDFNNLLAVTIGSLGLLQEATELESDDAELLAEALAAANRGAQLTQRLLAFSRKQALAPRDLDAAVLVHDILGFLRRSLGEMVDIEVRVLAGTSPVSADPVQLEHAIINLVLNARDAMPGGGHVVIEVSNVTVTASREPRLSKLASGEYLRISVSDDGTGMSPEVAARAFDPFFTTKPAGSGSGLGLSMVYGFASQSGGSAIIDSAEGVGTTVSLYLPSADELPSCSIDHEEGLGSVVHAAAHERQRTSGHHPRWEDPSTSRSRSGR